MFLFYKNRIIMESRLRCICIVALTHCHLNTMYLQEQVRGPKWVYWDLLSKKDIIQSHALRFRITWSYFWAPPVSCCRLPSSWAAVASIGGFVQTFIYVTNVFPSLLLGQKEWNCDGEFLLLLLDMLEYFHNQRCCR